MESLVASSFWRGKKVFITGHTGFKGSWMSLWLLKAGARLTGYSLGVPTQPSLFEELNISSEMNSLMGDIRDAVALKRAITEAQPEIVIHMAAQPLVRYSYREPVETYMTNVMGTVHLYEAVRAIPSVRSILNVTSDKCYENREQRAGYREDDPMGGYDPYSSSKGCAELVTSAYRRSFFNGAGIGLASGRAGNVIGGGDWAEDRLITDAVRAVVKNETLVIRNPNAVRPWQHVLEPLSGYLVLAQKLNEKKDLFSRGYNFGPSSAGHCSVEGVLQQISQIWQGKLRYQIEESSQNPHEAGMLSLDCTRAEHELNWKPRWSLSQSLEKTVSWNLRYMDSEPARTICLEQISEYERSGHV